MRRMLLLICMGLAGTACAHRSSTTLGVQGRSNAYVTLASDGDVLAAAWAASGEGETDAYLAISRDGGRTFAAPVRVNDVAGDVSATGEQPPRVVVHGSVVDVLWVSRRAGSAIRVARSTDGGSTFGGSHTVSPEGVTGIRGWESAALSDNGIVHAVWLDGRNNPTAMAPAGHHEGMVMPKTSPRQDIFHAAWDGHTLVESQVASNVCFCCKTAVVTSGSQVLVAWRHLFPGGVRDIAVAHSTDGGKTFSEPVRVSNDNWKIDACPDDGPALALGRDGALHIIWPTMAADPDKPRMAVFDAVSRDGGATFSPRSRLSGAGASAAHPRVSSMGGHVAEVWDETVDHVRHVRMSTDGRSPRDVAEGNATSYPSLARIKGGWVVAWTTQNGDTSGIDVRVISD